MFKKINNLPDDIFGIEINGTLSKEDYEEMDKLIAEDRDEKEDLKFLMVFHEFEWENFEAFWADLTMDIKYLGRVEKTAVVSEKKWLHAITDAINVVTPKMKSKHFELAEREKAIQWLQEDD